MIHKKCGLAIFVKTPGHSPIKTRLAKTIGQEKAEAYYILSLKAVATLVDRMSDVQPYWAVAEDSAMNHELWKQYPKINQGTGDLGNRLSLVYNSLLEQHDSVVLIGADSPQLTAETLINGSEKSLAGFVLGPSNDGGFYLFGGNKKISESVWTGIRYSEDSTAFELLRALQPANVAMLERFLDTDTFDDVKDLYSGFQNYKNPTPAQNDLIKWLETNLGL